MEKEAKEYIVKEMILAIGEDPNRQGLTGTPDRVVRSWEEMFRGYDEKQKPRITTFKNGMDGITYDQMANDTGSFYSHCEHHIIPFFGKYYFAYIPNKNGRILGLSKVARVVDYYSAKLQIQERLVQEVVDTLWKALQIPNDIGDRPEPNKKKNPIGMALVMDGEHLCKTMRGAKKKGKMRTSCLKGAFKDDPATRAEFYNWVKQNGNN